MVNFLRRLEGWVSTCSGIAPSNSSWQYRCHCTSIAITTQVPTIISNTRMEKLAPELRDMILKRLEGRDLKSAVLVCHSWQDWTEGLLYESVPVIARRAYLKPMPKAFQSNANTVVYYYEFPEDWQLLAGRFEDVACKKKGAKQTHLLKHVEHCRKLKEEAEDIRTEQSVYNNLCKLLNSRPITKGQKTSSASFWETANRLRQNADHVTGLSVVLRRHFGICWCCQAPNHTLDAAPASSHCRKVCEKLMFHTAKQTYEWWKTIMQAIQATQKSITKFAMESSDDDNCGLPFRTISLSSKGWSNTISKLFSELTDLRLTFDMSDVSQSISPAWFSNALCRATRLKCLYIRLLNVHQEGDSSCLQMMFAECHLPSLTTLSLHGCRSREQELITLLHQFSGLQSLIMRYHQLEGDWMSLVQALRGKVRTLHIQNIPLKSQKFVKLLDGIFRAEKGPISGAGSSGFGSSNEMEDDSCSSDDIFSSSGSSTDSDSDVGSKTSS